MYHLRVIYNDTIINNNIRCHPIVSSSWLKNLRMIRSKRLIRRLPFITVQKEPFKNHAKGSLSNDTHLSDKHTENFLHMIKNLI